jgi:hypothetical protein
LTQETRKQKPRVRLPPNASSKHSYFGSYAHQVAGW